MISLTLIIPQIITLILIYLGWRALGSTVKNWLTKHRRGIWYVLWPIIFGFWSIILQGFLFAALIASTSEIIAVGLLSLRARKV